MEREAPRHLCRSLEFVVDVALDAPLVFGPEVEAVRLEARRALQPPLQQSRMREHEYIEAS